MSYSLPKMPLRRGQQGRLRANASPTRASVPFLVVTEPVPISTEIYLVGRFAAQRAFFYAGGRSLLVSHWEVETNSAVALMTGTFAALAANPQLSHGEALR